MNYNCVKSSILLKCLVFLFFLSPFSFFSQSVGCVPEAISGYEKVELLVDKSYEYGIQGDYKNQKKFALKAVDNSEEIAEKYQCYSAMAYWALATALSNLGDFDGALKAAQDAYAFCENFKREDCSCKSTSLMKIGNARSAMGNDSLALLEYQKALEICEVESGQKMMEAYILQTAGDLEIRVGNIESALLKLNKAENIIHEIGTAYDFSQLILGRCMSSIGVILYQKNSCDEALTKLLTGLQISKDVYDRRTSATCNYYIARIYDHLSKYNEALNNYQESAYLAEKMGDTLLMVDSYNFIGNIYISRGEDAHAAEIISKSFGLSKLSNYKKGKADAYNIDASSKLILFNDSSETIIDILTQAKSALTNAMEIGYQHGMAEAYNNLENYYENIKDYKMAMFYAQKALDLSDSINYKIIVVDSYNNLGDICFRNNKNLDSTLRYFEMAIEIASSGSYNNCGVYKEGIVDSYNKIAYAYMKRKKRDLAYTNFYNALEIAREMEYAIGIKQAEDGIRDLTGAPPPSGKEWRKILN